MATPTADHPGWDCWLTWPTWLLAVYFGGRQLRHLCTDSGFAGTLVGWAARLLSVTVEVVRRPAGQRGFQVLPRRWVVERTLAWLTAHRRLARDYERLPGRSESFIHWAMIGTMVRRIDRGRPATRPGRRPLLKVIDPKLKGFYSRA